MSDIIVTQVFIFTRDGKLKSNATCSVGGIGEVKFENSISDDLCERIRSEVETALRIRMGQKIKAAS